jgi:N-acetylglucosaminyl-diphospho-decaprenol L-rhamnosyltransferase
VIGVAERVGAVVVDYHAGAALAACIASLHDNGVSDVVVVNNADVGASNAAVAGRGVTLVEPAVNLGYGAGINRGAARTTHELLLVSNPDVTYHENALAALMRYLDEHPDVGIVGPTILTEAGQPYPSVRVFPSVWLAAAHALLSPVNPTNRWSVRYRSPGADGRVDWVSGACMLVRRDLFEQLGGFDERYFMFAEEMDLCWRAREVGSSVAATPDAVITHVEGLSRQIAPHRTMVMAHHRSALRFEWRTARGARRLLAPLASVVLLARLAIVLARPGASRGRP